MIFLAGAGCAIFLGDATELEGELRPARPARSTHGAPAEQPGLPQGSAAAISCRARRLGAFTILVSANPPGRVAVTARKRGARALRRQAAAQKAAPPGSPARLSLNLPVRLSDDQQAVRRLLLRGLNNTQIAARLGRKRRWVCYRVAELKRLFGAHTRDEINRAAPVIQ